MFDFIRRKFGKPVVEEVTEVPARSSIMSTHRGDTLPSQRMSEISANLTNIWSNYLRAHAPRALATDGTMDDDDSQGWNAIKSAYSMGQPNMSDALFQWYGTQSFIGHQACAILFVSGEAFDVVDAVSGGG